MRKALVVLLALAVCVLPVLAERREVGSDNPFATPTIDLWPLIQHYRQVLGLKQIEINERNPFDGKYFHFLWCEGMNAQGLRQMYEALKEFSPTTLKQLSSISYFGSPRTLFRLLLFFKFPDEEAMAKNKFFVVEMPDWWLVIPRGF